MVTILGLKCRFVRRRAKKQAVYVFSVWFWLFEMSNHRAWSQSLSFMLRSAYVWRSSAVHPVDSNYGFEQLSGKDNWASIPSHVLLLWFAAPALQFVRAQLNPLHVDFYCARYSSGEINMAVHSENSSHTCSLLLQLSFARSGGKELVDAWSDFRYNVNCACAFSKLFRTC